MYYFPPSDELEKLRAELSREHAPPIKEHELLAATLNNDITKVNDLLVSGVNVNFQGFGGYTALLIAAEQNSLELVELLMINGADLSLHRNDGWGARILATDTLVIRTIEHKQILNQETKLALLARNDIYNDEDEERWEKGRLKALADRNGQPFALSQLKMRPTDGQFAPPPSEAQFIELEQHFGHPLPTNLKEIFTQYNGCYPGLSYYGDDEDSSIHYFYILDENKNAFGSVWWSINTYSQYLGAETVPFAEDHYGGVYFLKWVDGNAQVWLFQYGDQLFAEEDNDNIDDDSKMPTASSFIFNSFDNLLEALYATED